MHCCWHHDRGAHTSIKPAELLHQMGIGTAPIERELSMKVDTAHGVLGLEETRVRLGDRTVSDKFEHQRDLKHNRREGQRLNLVGWRLTGHAVPCDTP